MLFEKLISQTIAAYRNKTSVLEYIVAAGITGGISRFDMGLRGIFSGALVGTVLGSAIGLIGFSMMTAYDVTQQDRHLKAVISKMEVERSIIGDASFHEKVAEAIHDQEMKKSITPA